MSESRERVETALAAFRAAENLRRELDGALMDLMRASSRLDAGEYATFREEARGVSR